MRFLQKLLFGGYMDKDSSPEKIDPNNYTDAKNISFLTNNTESTQDHTPMLGNIRAFSLGSIIVQNKTYRLYTSDTSAAPEPSFATLLFYSNGIQFGTPTGATATYVVRWNRNQSIINQSNAIETAINAWGLGAISTVDAGATYVDITLEFISGYDFTITATNGNSVAMTFNTHREAYDATLTGTLNVIGSYDLLGDLYVWSTPSTNLTLKTTLSVSSVVLVFVGARALYKVNFTIAHGLQVGQSITLIANMVLPTDGTWIVSSTGFTSTSIVLEDYFSKAVFVLPANTTMQVILYSNSVGEVGVAQYTASTASWLYTRLGRTKQWGFRTKKQVDTYCEQTSVKSSIYWTDDYNVPRAIYYIKEYDENGNLLPFDADGIISTINPSGLYTYDTIATESKLQLSSTSSKIDYLPQIQSGGQITSGNWKYAIRFLTSTLVSTEPTDLTNPISVFTASTDGSPYILTGDAPATVTSKINQLQVTEILPGLFKYIELLAVNYTGDSVQGYVIRRELLTDTQTSITLNHTGTETAVTNLDLGLLNQKFEAISTAKNIDVIDKRMILSNLTTQARIDLTSWAQSFRHFLFKQSIDSVRGNVQGRLRVAEYMLPSNVSSFAGYMQNETYRFGVKVKFKKGGYSDVYWVDDICFTTFGTNLKPDGTAASTNPTRRTAGLPDLNLTDAVNSPPVETTIVYVPSVEFTNINLDFRVDGIPLRNLIESFSIERVECVSEVIAAGIGVLSVYGGAASSNSVTGTNWVISAAPPPYIPVNSANIAEYPFVSGNTAFVGANNPIYPDATSTFVAERRYCAFYSPDILFNNTSINFTSSDKLINCGNPVNIAFNNGYTASGDAYSNYAQYSGVTDVTNATLQFTYPMEIGFIGEGSSSIIGSNTFHKNNSIQKISTATLGFANSMEGYVFHTSTSGAFTNPSGKSDYGLRYLQYYRALTDKYGDVENSRYVSCGHIFEVTDSMPSLQTTIVFGGDTFTQLSYLRHRNGNTIDAGLGGGLSFYSQNRINVQMKTSGGNVVYPNIGTAFWLERQAGDNEKYDNGYNIRNEVKSDVSFNSSLGATTDFPARIAYSPIKPQGSPSDQYRIYLPLDYHDLDQSHGEIVHHANGNGELLTWQQRAFMRQYFDTRGTLQVKGIGEVLIGDGSVMSRDGITISKLGSKHKWAIIKGKSTGGNDVFYWLNTEIKKALRFGYDGTVSIADIKGMQSFIANNVTWVNTHDTPADGDGICGFWDDRYANAGWTANGSNPSVIINNWASAGFYLPTNKVFYPNDPFISKQYTYESIGNGVNINHQPDISPTWWKLIPNDGTYFNKYTLIFNEFKNAFICSATFTPKIYLKWTDTFLSPRPIVHPEAVYEHNKGKYCWWYEFEGVKQTERAYIEGVVNNPLDETKRMEALSIDSEVSPIRVEFITKQHQSFLIQSEFTSREDSYVSSIKKDSTTSGINSSNTTSLFGKWCKVKIFFEVDVYQKLSNLTVKFRISPRIKSK